MKEKMQMSKTSYFKSIIPPAIFICLIFIISLLCPQEDYIDGINCSEDALSSVEDTSIVTQLVDEIFDIKTENQINDWTCLQTAATPIESGNYILKLQYTSDCEHLAYRIYTDQDMSENGETYETFSEGPIEQTDSLDINKCITIRIPFSLNQEKTGIHVLFLHDSGTFYINECEILPEHGDTDRLWYAIFLSVAVLTLWLLLTKVYFGKERRSSRAIIAIITITFIYMCLPYMNDYIISGHDVAFHLTRIEGIYEALRDGQIPMWINTHEWYTYGYATPIEYPQIFLFIPALLRLAGMSLLNAYKIFMYMINLAVLIISYFSFKIIFKQRFPALIATLSYCLSVYFLVNIYLRIAVGEILAMVFMPLFAAACYELFYGNENKWILASISITMVLGCHLISTYLYALIALVLFVFTIPIILKKNIKKRIVSIAKAAFTALLLNIYFLIPFLTYQKENLNINNTTKGGVNEVRDFYTYTTYISELFISDTTPTGISEALGTSNEMPLSVGFFSLVVLLSAFILLCIFGKNIHRRAPRIINLSLIGLIASTVLLYMSSSICPWDKLVYIPLVNMILDIQFPWRLLGPATLFIAMTTGGITQIIYLEKEYITARLFGTNRNLRGQLSEEGKLFYNIVGGIIICLIFFNSFSITQNTSLIDTINGKGKVATTEFTDIWYNYGNTNPELAITRGDIITSSVENVRITSYQKSKHTFNFIMNFLKVWRKRHLFYH